MLNFSIHKLRLEHTLRTPLVDQEPSRRRIPRSLRTPLSHHSSELAPFSDHVIHHGEVLATRNDVSVSEMSSDDGVVLDGSVGDDGLGVVGPGSGTDVDGDFEVG